MAAKNKKPNELNIVRVYDAPVKAVWEAWTDPKQAAKWWGPRGFTITTHSKELRPGGFWKYTMHGPDGVDYPNHTTYFEVEDYAKLVYDHGANDTQAALFRVTVLFSESKGKTTMDMTMALATPEAAEQIKKFVKFAGGNSTWDRLGEYLEKTSSGEEKFIFHRTFEAPFEALQEALAELSIHKTSEIHIELTEESSGETRMKVEVSFGDTTTQDQLAEKKKNLVQDWTANFAKLEELLKVESF